MESAAYTRLCTVILAVASPKREVRVTADEARRLLIWMGHRRIGKPANADFTLVLAKPVDGHDSIRLTSPRDVLRLDRRSGSRKVYDVDRRDSASN